MTDRGLRALAAVLAVALVAVLVTGTLVSARAVSDDLRTRVEAALFEAGLSDVAVKVTGREVELRPTTERDLIRATRVAESVEGVRWARLDPSIGTADLRPTVAFIDLETDGSSLRISGAVHDAATAADLKASASSAFGTAVRGDLMIDPTLPEADWTDELPGLFGDLAPVKDVALSVDDGDVLRLAGHIESTRGRDRVISLATSGLPELRIAAEITVDAGPLADEDATLLNTFTVFYPFGGTSLTADDLAALEGVVDVIERQPGLQLEIAAHTGPDGDDGRGDARERADVVRRALIDLGVDADRLSTTVYVSRDRDGDERYRRVDLVVEGV